MYAHPKNERQTPVAGRISGVRSSMLVFWGRRERFGWSLWRVACGSWKGQRAVRESSSPTRWRRYGRWGVTEETGLRSESAVRRLRGQRFLQREVREGLQESTSDPNDLFPQATSNTPRAGSPTCYRPQAASAPPEFDESTSDPSRRILGTCSLVRTVTGHVPAFGSDFYARCRQKAYDHIRFAYGDRGCWRNCWALRLE